MSGLSVPEKGRRAADDLGLKIVTPFEFIPPSGHRVFVPVLLREFGARHGMLITENYGSIESSVDEIISSGFGFSVITLPANYNRESLIAVLRDWSWSGASDQMPLWLNEED